MALFRYIFTIISSYIKFIMSCVYHYIILCYINLCVSKDFSDSKCKQFIAVVLNLFLIFIRKNNKPPIYFCHIVEYDYLFASGIDFIYYLLMTKIND